jgi:hypothetical protein
MRCNLFGSFGLPTAVATVLLVAGSVLAQGQPGGGAGRPERPMGGPPVGQRPSQVEERFTQPMGGARPQQGQRAIPHAEFMAVVWMLSDQDAPTALRLNGEQEKNIAAIDREFQDASRAHAQRLRELARPDAEVTPPARGEAPRRGTGDGAGGAGGGAGGGEGGAARPDGQPQRRRLSEDDRERIEQLRMSAPRPAEAHTKIFAELTETQRIFVQEEIEDRRRMLERQRDEEMARRRLAMRDGGMGGEGMGGNPDAAAQQRQRVGRIFMRLQQMPPEERDRLIARLEQDLERRARELGLEDLPEQGWGWGQGGRPQGGRRGPAGGEGGNDAPEGERPRRRQGPGSGDRPNPPRI